MKRALIAIAIAACGEPKTEFECDGNDACRDGTATGVCEATGFCSFDASDCPTGRRYGAAAGDGLGEQCVDEGPLPVGDWQFSTSLPAIRYNLAATADDSTIYAIGGITGNTAFPDVSIGPVTSTAFGASLPAWSSGAPLPAPRRSFGAAISDGFLYVMGGRVESPDIAASSDVLSAPIEGSGIGEWRTTSALPVGLRCHAVAQSGNTVYVAGGKGSASDDGVTSVVIGTMSGGDVTWRPGSPMATPRYCHSLTVANGYLFAIGGCRAGNNACPAGPLDSIEVAKIQDDGSLGPFVATRSLPYGLWHHTSAGNAHYLVVAAGRDVNDDPNGISKVLVTHINRDGSLGVWREAKPLAQARTRSSAVVVSDQLFLIGADVQTATLAP